MELKDKFIKVCKEDIHREGLNELLTWLDRSDFYIAPASSRFHGNYEGGLLEHSLNVRDTLLKLCEIYDYGYSKETLSIVSLFHDICKANFYKKEKRNVKDQKTSQWIEKDVWTIDEKVPLGHGEKSCIILQSFMKITLDELLAIRWHMGGFDSAVKGGDYGLSKAQDESKLVTLLHIADSIASHLLEKKID